VKKRGKNAKTAESLGITTQCLGRWKRAGCPVDRGPRAIRAWRDKNVRPQHGGHSSKTKPRDSIQERLLLAQCAKAEEQVRAERIANDRAEGVVVRVEDAVLEVAELCGMVRDQITGWPESIVSEMPQEVRSHVHDLLTDQVHLLLTRMSQYRFESLKTTVDHLEKHNGRKEIHR